MSSNSKVVVTISKNSCWNLLHPCITALLHYCIPALLHYCITALLQRYFNKIVRGITITSDSIIKRLPKKPCIECPTIKKRFRQGSNQDFSSLKFKGPFSDQAHGFTKAGYHHPIPL